MDPVVVSNLLSDEDFNTLKTYFLNLPMLANLDYDDLGRKVIGSTNDSFLESFNHKILEKTREVFGSTTLLPSYSNFAEYSATTIRLPEHKDSNACTYTVDLVLYQDQQWNISVQGKEYPLNPNEAVCYLGNDHLHGRQTIENNTNKVGVIFFHFVEPDHWWFTKGPDYIKTIWAQARQ